jgi:hypothetical protein
MIRTRKLQQLIVCQFTLAANPNWEIDGLERKVLADILLPSRTSAQPVAFAPAMPLQPQCREWAEVLAISSSNPPMTLLPASVCSILRRSSKCEERLAIFHRLDV